MVAKAVQDLPVRPVQTVNAEQLSTVRLAILLELLAVVALNTGACHCLKLIFIPLLISNNYIRWCGSTPAHCLAANGCQNGCTGEMSSPPATTTAEPVLSRPATTTTGEPRLSPTGAVTTNGTCGSSNGGTVCGNWPNGNCCSMYGFW